MRAILVAVELMLAYVCASQIAKGFAASWPLGLFCVAVTLLCLFFAYDIARDTP
jgi:hypothetical protein